MAARAAHQTPQQRKTYPHPIIQSVPKLHKTIRHPGKARLPRLYWTPPPCGGTDASKTPTPEPGPKRMHQPMLPAAHQPGPKPPRPSRNPTRGRAPPDPQTPPGPTPEQCGRQAGKPTSAGTGIPSSAACRRQRNSIQESPIPPSRPRPQPQRRTPQETHPQGTPRCPRPILPPHANNKNHSRTESGPPPTLGDGADQREPREIDLMCQQKLFSRLI